MTCAEFQKVLPYIIETGGNTDEEQHLRDCPVCSDLVADLKYIAEQAKLLVPMEDPSPQVWEGIRGSLEREGLVRPARARGRLLGSQRWNSLPWLSLAVAIALIIFGVFLYQQSRLQHHSSESAAVAPATVPLQRVATNEDDQQFLQTVSSLHPGIASTFQENLDQVNASIADARKAVEANPEDPYARQSLARAYRQKAMLYELAMRWVQ